MKRKIICILVLGLLFLAPMTVGKPGNSQTQSYSWNARITPTFPDGIDDAIFWVRPDATTGFDIAYDILEPPPAWPPYVRAFFHYPEQTQAELHRSCIPPGDIMEWPLRISYRDGTDNITLSWSIENIPAEYFVHLLKGENLMANMRVADNYTFQTSAGDYDFTVRVYKIGRGVEISISPSYQSGLPGATLTYLVTVNNTGSISETYNLTASDDAGWGPGVSPPTLAVPAGGNGAATLSVTIPSGTAECTRDNIRASVVSQSDPAVKDDDSCIAHAVAVPLPPTPSLVSPTNGARITDNTPLLEWSDVSVTYDLSIAKDAEFTSTVLMKTGLTASTYELTPVEAFAIGSYYWRVRAVDGAGKVGSWSESWSFTVVAPPTPTSVEIPLITPEAPARVEVENTAVTVLDISVLDTVENVRIIVRELVDRPAEIAIAAPGAIYRYLEIIEENITDNDISSVTITFKVEKTWIEGENIDENTITLKRYNTENGEWVSLPTVKVDEDATYVYFSVTSPRLSYFAISGTAISPAPAAFTVSTLTINPSEVSAGEEVSISVTVKNTGDLEGTHTVTLEINGAVEGIENVMVAGESQRPVTFTVTEDVEATYNVEVDGLTGTFAVTKTPPVSTNWPLIAGIVGVLVIIGITFVFYMRRRFFKERF